jgi:excisionase family DNA binding protein
MYLRADEGAKMSTGNAGLDALADAIAERVIARMEGDGRPRLLSVVEAAKHLAVSVRTLRSKIASGEITATRDGRIVRLDRRALDQWIEFRQSKG